MASRICPECDSRTDAEVCPKCRSRTMRERRDDSPDPFVGRVLDGRYSVDALVGRGGMGAVYRGVQLATKQTVAIKVIRAENAMNQEAARRFHREARAASLLAHPHTIRVFDFGESEEGDLYMVLEFLSGRPLSCVFREDGPLTEVRAAKVACEVAQSLAEAHGHGLAHRDLKPDNVMLLDAFGDPDFVKVLDFGIAKFITGSTGESSVTRTGAVVGTPQYMAPEQVRGTIGLTPAMDVYALGILLYEAFCGQRPFDGDTPFDVLMKHVNLPVPEIPAGCRISDGMRDLIRQMLAKDPAARPSAAEAAGRFEELRMNALFCERAATPTPPVRDAATVPPVRIVTPAPVRVPTPNGTLADRSHSGAAIDLPLTTPMAIDVPGTERMSHAVDRIPHGPAPQDPVPRDPVPDDVPAVAPATGEAARRPRWWPYAVAAVVVLGAAVGLALGAGLVGGGQGQDPVRAQVQAPEQVQAPVQVQAPDPGQEPVPTRESDLVPPPARVPEAVAPVAAPAPVPAPAVTAPPGASPRPTPKPMPKSTPGATPKQTPKPAPRPAQKPSSGYNVFD